MSIGYLMVLKPQIDNYNYQTLHSKHQSLGETVIMSKLVLSYTVLSLRYRGELIRFY